MRVSKRRASLIRDLPTFLPVYSKLPHLVKVRLHPPVPDPVDLELEPEARAVDDHLEREVEVVELDAARRREPREEAARHGAQVRRQRAHMR